MVADGLPGGLELARLGDYGDLPGRAGGEAHRVRRWLDCARDASSCADLRRGCHHAGCPVQLLEAFHGYLLALVRQDENSYRRAQIAAVECRDGEVTGTGRDLHAVDADTALAFRRPFLCACQLLLGALLGV